LDQVCKTARSRHTSSVRSLLFPYAYLDRFGDVDFRARSANEKNEIHQMWGMGIKGRINVGLVLIRIRSVLGIAYTLGGIITDAPLEADEGMEKDRCGKCRACQESCPTSALDEPYRLNRERCVSHLLSEESLPHEAYQFVGNKVLDCEVCQLVCPWNKRHLEEPLVTERIRLFRQKLITLNSFFKLTNLARMTEAEYDEFIRPYRTTIPYRIFRRNVIAALGHSNDQGGNWGRC